MFQRPHSRFSYEGKQRMVGWIFPLPLFRLLTQAPLLASVQTPARLHQIKHKEDVLFTPLAYTSVPRSFFSSAFCVFFSVDNAPLFPWTWELWEFQSASRRPRRFSSNRISAEATLRPPPKWRWTNQIEVSCQENDAHPSMIDAHRWKWQVMDTLVFNNTTSCVNLTLKMHACTYIYIHRRERPPAPAAHWHVCRAIFDCRDLPEWTSPPLRLLQHGHSFHHLALSTLQR